MVNNEEFAKRLQKVIDFYGESASSFAEKVGVQRSSISHILSGRNKPSLEFVLKILSTFPEVELYWLLNGKGSFPKKSEPNSNGSQKTNTVSAEETDQVHSNTGTKNKTIDRIIIFYSDGSFENFQN